MKTEDGIKGVGLTRRVDLYSIKRGTLKWLDANISHRLAKKPALRSQSFISSGQGTSMYKDEVEINISTSEKRK